jgi:exonuclease SbcD
MSKIRILHTSDWHIGQRFHGKDRSKEHEQFFAYLLQLITAKQIDVLLVAGDIFDVGYPSNSALQQYYRFLTNCLKTYCKQIVIIGGNHDYISTLNAPQSILDALQIQVIGGATSNLEDEIIELKNSQGKLAAYLCAVPFLRDRDIRTSVAGESHEDRIASMREGIARHYTELADLVKQRNTKHLPVIASGHLYMAGVSLSESERDIQMGNQAAFQWDAFPQDFDYVALGHIHRPQRVAGQEHVRYSGSPIPLSFSEKNDEKQVLIVELDESGVSTIEVEKVPAARKLLGVSGSLEEIREKLQVYTSSSEEKDWCEITVQEEKYDPKLIQEYKELLEHEFDLEIVKSSIAFADRKESLTSLYEEQTSLRDLSNQEVFEKLLERSDYQEQEELLNTYQQLLAEMNESES